MSAIASDRLFVDAVVAELEGAGLLVGDAVAPDAITHDTQGRLTSPYCIVYPMPSGGTSGPMSAPHADEDMVVQVTAVGRTREQAQWVADTAKATLLAGISITGRALSSRPGLDVGSGLQRDDDTAGPPLFYAVHRYRFPTTPA